MNYHFSFLSILKKLLTPGYKANLLFFLFCSLILIALSERLNKNSEIILWFSCYLWVHLFTFWIKNDSLHKKIKLPFDLGLLVFQVWFLLIPWYLFSTRGFIRSSIIIIIYISLLIASIVLSVLLS
jgi:hypothetical protein